VELELLMAWSPGQIAANALSYTLDKNAFSAKLQAQMDEMREQALRFQNEAVLNLAEGASGNIDDYAIFGIWHAKPSLWQFILDIRPLILISLYTMGYETTKQMLLLNHCDPFAVEDDQGLVSMDDRWMKHANWKCNDWDSDHVAVGLTSWAGLFVWSIGFHVMLAFFIFRNRRRISEPSVTRLYAYFVQGYEIEYCWWDILVKRLDLFATIAITYTNFAPNKKAKLLCYSSLAAIVLILHASAAPFDDRKCRLLDRYEYLGLLVRFFTFTALQLILVFNPDKWVGIICCVGIGIAGTAYLLCIWFTIVIEFITDITSRGHEATAEDLEELLGVDEDTAGRHSHRGAGVIGAVTSPGKIIAKYCGKYVFRAFLNVLLRIATRIAMFYSKLEETALAIKFDDGRLCIWTRNVQEAEEMFQGGKLNKSMKDKAKLKGEHSLEAFFHLNDGSQREYLATIIGAYYAHVLCTMGSDEIPRRSLECFLVFAACVKAAKSDPEVKWQACGVKEKYECMLKGIPAAVKCITEKQDGDLGTELQGDNKGERREPTVRDHVEYDDIGKPKKEKSSVSLVSSKVEEALEEQERKDASEKTMLRAEMLNETLMILYRVERAQFFKGLKLVEEAMKGKWVETPGELDSKTPLTPGAGNGNGTESAGDGTKVDDVEVAIATEGTTDV